MAKAGLRIVAGVWGGRKIAPPPPGVNTRPTSNKVKEALFDMLMNDIPGARLLDAFAGTGQLGVEALSRGAAEVVFVETEPRMRAVLTANLNALPHEGRGRVQAGDARAALRAFAAGGGPRFNVVILDPPFLEGAYRGLLNETPWSAVLAPDGVISVEHPVGFDPLGGEDRLRTGDAELVRTRLRRYGRVQVSLLRFAEPGTPA